MCFPAGRKNTRNLKCPPELDIKKTCWQNFSRIGYCKWLDHSGYYINRSVKYQPCRWPNRNFAYDLRWSIHITGENFKSEGKVKPEFRRGVSGADLTVTRLIQGCNTDLSNVDIAVVKDTQNTRNMWTAIISCNDFSVFVMSFLILRIRSCASFANKGGRQG